MKKLLFALAFLLLPTLARAQPADPTGSKGSFTPFVRSTSLTVTAPGDTLVLPVWGRQGLALSVITSNLVSTLNVEASVDGGATYDGSGTFATMVQYGLSYGPSLNTGGSNVRRMISVGGGVTHVRIVAAVVTSGTGVVSLTATPSSASFPAYGTPTDVSGTVSALQSGPWTVTSDAGTGWAASGLAKESGGNLAAIAAALASTLTIQFSAPQHVIVDSGTVAATQSGVWTVQPGNTANTTAWKVDGSAVTQPVSGTFWPTLASAPASVRGGDGTNFYSATNPAPVVSQGQSLSAAYVNATASGDTALLAGASLGNRIYRVECNNTSATVAVVAILKLGSTTIGKVALPAAVGQKVWQFAGPNYLPTGASTAVNINLSAGSADVGCSTFYVAN